MWRYKCVIWDIWCSCTPRPLWRYNLELKTVCEIFLPKPSLVWFISNKTIQYQKQHLTWISKVMWMINCAQRLKTTWTEFNFTLYKNRVLWADAYSTDHVISTTDHHPRTVHLNGLKPCFPNAGIRVLLLMCLRTKLNNFVRGTEENARETFLGNG